MNSITPSLEDVKRDFDQWRSLKKSKRERTPLSLCLAASQLKPHYPIHKILQQLNISFNAFKAFQEKATGASPPRKRASPLKTDTLSFVPFSLEASAIEKAGAFQIIKPDGTQLIIQAADPLSIMRAFLCSP